MQKFIVFALSCLALLFVNTSCGQVSDTQPNSVVEEADNIAQETDNSVNVASDCEVDISRTPEINESDKQLILTSCSGLYSRVTEIIDGNPTPPPTSIPIVFEEGIGTAYSQDGKIFLDKQWFITNRENQQEISGVLAHEMVHVVQAYQKEVPLWVVEGIADYVRFSMGYSSEFALSCTGGKYYSDNESTSVYSCAPAFFNYVGKYHPGAIAKLNLAFRANGYDDAFFTQADVTGQTPEQLWQGCLNEDCEGGRSQP